MKKSLIIIILGFVSILIESFLHFFLGSASDVVPNFTLMIVVYLGFYEATPLGALLSFILGLELDLSSGILIGPWAGVFTLIFGSLAVLSQRIFIDSALSASVAIFVANMIGSGLYLIVTYSSGSSNARTFWEIVIEAVATAVVAPILFSLLNKKIIKKLNSRSSLKSRGSRGG